MSLPAHKSLSQDEAWTSLQHATWDALRAQLAGTGRWRKEIVVALLRHHAALHRFYPRRNPLPTVRALAEEVGWPLMTLHGFLRSGDWIDPVSPCAWRKNEPKQSAQPIAPAVSLVPEPEPKEVPVTHNKLDALRQAVSNADAKHEKHVEKVELRIAKGDVRPADILKELDRYRNLNGKTCFKFSHADNATAKNIATIDNAVEYVRWVGENWEAIKETPGFYGELELFQLWNKKAILYEAFKSKKIPEKFKSWADSKHEKKMARLMANEHDPVDHAARMAANGGRVPDPFACLDE